MDMIRRNTDYALLLMRNLAEHYGKEVLSSRVLADKEEVSYQLTCKLMQKLHAAGLVKSLMGPKGGFFLSKNPFEITLKEIVETIQGPISVNRCFLGIHVCSKQSDCSISTKLSELQVSIERFFSNVTLDQLLRNKNSKKKLQQKNQRPMTKLHQEIPLSKGKTNETSNYRNRRKKM